MYSAAEFLKNATKTQLTLKMAPPVGSIGSTKGKFKSNPESPNPQHTEKTLTSRQRTSRDSGYKPDKYETKVESSGQSAMDFGQLQTPVQMMADRITRGTPTDPTSTRMSQSTNKQTGRGAVG